MLIFTCTELQTDTGLAAIRENASGSLAGLAERLTALRLAGMKQKVQRGDKVVVSKVAK